MKPADGGVVFFLAAGAPDPFTIPRERVQHGQLVHLIKSEFFIKSHDNFGLIFFHRGEEIHHLMGAWDS